VLQIQDLRKEVSRRKLSTSSRGKAVLVARLKEAILSDGAAPAEADGAAVVDGAGAAVGANGEGKNFSKVRALQLFLHATNTVICMVCLESKSA